MAFKKFNSINFSLIFLNYLILSVALASAQQISNQSYQPISSYRPITDTDASTKFEVRIDTLTKVYFGTFIEISVTLKSGAFRLGGFDFLIRHNPAAISFQSIEPGPALFSDSGCAWQYFDFRYGPSGNCGTSACKTGIIRVVSVANINNNILPNCWSFDEEVVIFTLKFRFTNDATYDCYLSPIEFVWYDCFDNNILFDSSSSGTVRMDELAGVKTVFSNGFPLQPDSTFPSDGGLTESCFDSASLFSIVNFYNGGIETICYHIDDRGDINLNGIANEVADADLFSEYFIKGLKVFIINAAGQIAATDINRDGEVLKLEDLVYLERIVEGNALPFADSTISGQTNIIDNNYAKRVTIVTDQPKVKVWLKFKGEVTPTDNAGNTEQMWHYDGHFSRFLLNVSQTDNQEVIELLNYTGKGTLVEAQASTLEGYEIIIAIKEIGSNLPEKYILHQNFPNPFNGETSIRLDLPQAAKIKFEIVNVLGQVVYDFERQFSAGSHTIYWDGSSNLGQTVGSGVYYYRITAGDFVSSKKMMLLK